MARWRLRMGQPEAQAIYRVRAAAVECMNAQSRNRRLTRMPVRGLSKVRCIALQHEIKNFSGSESVRGRRFPTHKNTHFGQSRCQIGAVRLHHELTY
jgi:hypothetical protein